MNTTISNALSALRAFRSKFQTSAHNIANLNSENYKPYDAILKENPGGGVSADIRRNEGTYSVDLSKEAIEMIIADAGFRANLKVVKEADEMERETIDILA